MTGPSTKVTLIEHAVAAALAGEAEMTINELLRCLHVRRQWLFMALAGLVSRGLIVKGYRKAVALDGLVRRHTCFSRAVPLIYGNPAAKPPSSQVLKHRDSSSDACGKASLAGNGNPKHTGDTP